ncbi:MAG: RNA 3'-terminal phosphate cyclase [Candidatus Micrarchaeota archaeon]
MINIDGSFGSGGGQILRTALALSAFSGKAFTLEKIRAGKPNPGLQAQHCTCVSAVQEICGANVKGNEIGSQTLTFEPGAVKAGDYAFDVGTAGSCALVFQSIFLPLALAKEPSRITITGGTHVKWAPTADYVEKVFLPSIKSDSSFRVLQHGFYPQGNGVVEAEINPFEIKPIRFTERGKLKKITGASAVANLPLDIAKRQKLAALKKLPDFDAKIVEETVTARSPGTFVFLLAEYENAIAGFSALGAKGKGAEEVGREAADAFLRFNSSNACTDEHLGDQLIPFMALAKGKSEIRALLTPHLLTNVKTCGQFLDCKFEIEGNAGEVGIVSIEGIGFK